jgi:hypothetical protein
MIALSSASSAEFAAFMLAATGCKSYRPMVFRHLRPASDWIKKRQKLPLVTSTGYEFKSPLCELALDEWMTPGLHRVPGGFWWHRIDVCTKEWADDCQPMYSELLALLTAWAHLARRKAWDRLRSD